MPSLVLNHPHLTSMAKDDFTYWKCLQVLFSVKRGGKSDSNTTKHCLNKLNFQAKTPSICPCPQYVFSTSKLFKSTCNKTEILPKKNYEAVSSFSLWWPQSETDNEDEATVFPLPSNNLEESFSELTTGFDFCSCWSWSCKTCLKN